MPAWNGHTAEDGEIYECSDGNGMIAREFIPKATPPAPPPPDPEALIRTARASITLPDLDVTLGPDADHIAVNSWTWLYLDDGGNAAAFQPRKAHADDRGLAVDLEVTLASVAWSLGEPVDAAHPATKSPSVVCAGAGTPPPEDVNVREKPSCGYKYRWMSSKARTGGSGTWTVTATATWEFNWRFSTGATGTDTVQTGGTAQATVGEWRSVLVCGSQNC